MQALSEKEIAEVVEEVVKRLSAGTSPSTPSSLTAVGATGAAGDKKPGSCGCGCKCEHGNKGDCPECKAEQTKASKAVLDKGACRITATGSTECGDLAPYIDHTLLKADATEAEVEKLCAEARKHKFASVCVNTSYVETCARLLAGSEVMVCCVVGFPLGAMSTDAKAFETRTAISQGADEVDMVINVGKLESGNFTYVYDDIRAVVKAAAGHTVKVILETSLLNEDQKIAACVLSKAAGADFVKTSTGFSTGGATAEDIALMRRIVGDQMGVKASGGIRDCTTAQKMIDSGATRIGASASVGIVKGQQTKGGY
jgi:deoxyribose-phosphate aldolase